MSGVPDDGDESKRLQHLLNKMKKSLNPETDKDIKVSIHS